MDNAKILVEEVSNSVHVGITWFPRGYHIVPTWVSRGAHGYNIVPYMGITKCPWSYHMVPT